ncbi:probable G-protein coupled receptor 139 [Chiloscyllium punctatum]|uniref:probable G-protein coupled receptor 139 n=1 Tax=Chiloscyllium punctatum TaxID=137246 RepID=UPI003B6347B8
MEDTKSRQIMEGHITAAPESNSLAIVVLCQRKCGLSLCITFYLVAITIADFLVIMAGCVLNRIGGIYFRNSVLSTTPACTVTSVMVYATRDGSVWLTVAFTIDRFVAISWQKLKIRYCTKKTATLVIGMICSLSCVKNVPFCLVSQPLYIVDGVPWFCDINPIYYTSSFWKVYDKLDQILTPLLPFLLILLLNTLTVIHILKASRARKRLWGEGDRADPEMTNRRRSIVLLFAISISFLLLWATYVGRYLYVQLVGEGYFNGLDSSKPDIILQETTNMLQILSSCNNVFIYVVSQTKFREEMKKLLMCPFTTITNFTW